MHSTRQLLSVADGLAKFVVLKTLKISVRNCKSDASVMRKRLLRIRSNWRKIGPRRAFRGKIAEFARSRRRERGRIQDVPVVIQIERLAA